MSNPEQFAIVPVEGKSPADAIVVGPMPEVMKYLPQSVARNEEEQRLAQARADAVAISLQQEEVRACAAQMLADGMARLSERLDALVARRQERADQLRRDDEASEIAAIEQLLTRLPDPDLPAVTSSALATLSDDGDLKATKSPPDTEKYDPENPDLWDPEDVEDAVTGLMPNELDKGAPPEAGELTPSSPPPLKYRDPPSTGNP